MNNDIHIETFLDNLVKGRQSASATELQLTQHGDTDAAGSIAMHKAAVEAIKRFNVLQQVQQVHKMYMPAPGSVKPTRSITVKMVKWSIRVAATLLLIAGSWFAYQYTSNSSTRLYNEIYQSYTISTERGILDTPIESYSLITEFKNKNYIAVTKAYELFTKSGNREKFLAAFSYHEMGDYRKAVDLCTLILNNNKQANPKLYNDEAEFYAALSYLKLNDIKAAASLFNTIYNNPSHTFHERVSKRVMRRLNWLK